MNNLFKYWGKVFSNWKYLFLSLIVAFLFYSLNVFIANYKSIIDFSQSLGFFGSIQLFFSFSIGFIDIIKFSSFIATIIISLLLGVLFSLILYRAKNISGFDSAGGFLSTIGVILGSFAPGCATCGIGLASALGLSASFLAILPFKGFEISALAIIILLIAIFKISENSCNIMLKKKMKRGLENERRK